MKIIKNTNNNNNGNLICVFECTITNLATYRQFTIGCLRLNYSKKKIRIASLGYPSSYSATKDINKLNMFFCQCQCHSFCLRSWSISWKKRQARKLMDRFKNFTHL